MSRPWAWAVAQQVGRQSANYVVFLVLAMLLAPRDFGVVSLASSTIAFLSVFSEMGFSAALVQRARVEPGHLSTTFALNLAAGLVLTVLGIGAAGPLARFFHAPEAAPIFVALSAGFLLGAASVTQVALAQRELRFRELALRDTTAALFGGVVGIGLALSGWGVWSLVAQTLTTSAIGTALLWRLLPWRPRASEVSLERARELWGYSSKIFWFNVFKYFAQNADRLLVGYLGGPAPLGAYTFAYRLVISPVATVTGAIGSYLFPRFSRLQHDLAAVRAVYLRATGALDRAVLPLLAVAAVAAPLGVPLLFGTRWADAAILVQLFALVAAAQLIISPVGQLMKALDRPGWMFAWSLFFTGVTLGLIAIGSQWGVRGIGLGLVGAHLMGLGLASPIAVRLLGCRWSDLARSILPGLLLALGSGAVALLVLHVAPLSDRLRLGVAVVTGLSIAGTALLWLDRGLWQTLADGLRGGRVGPAGGEAI
jgi:O-antigen/teichoic acid export membrane protein